MKRLLHLLMCRPFAAASFLTLNHTDRSFDLVWLTQRFQMVFNTCSVIRDEIVCCSSTLPDTLTICPSVCFSFLVFARHLLLPQNNFKNHPTMCFSLQLLELHLYKQSRNPNLTVSQTWLLLSAPVFTRPAPIKTQKLLWVEK